MDHKQKKKKRKIYKVLDSDKGYGKIDSGGGSWQVLGWGCTEKVSFE